MNKVLLNLKVTLGVTEKKVKDSDIKLDIPEILLT